MQLLYSRKEIIGQLFTRKNVQNNTISKYLPTSKYRSQPLTHFNTPISQNTNQFSFQILLLILILYQLDIQAMFSANKVLSSPFQSSSKKKRRDIDRFIPHSVSKNLYNLFNEAQEMQPSSSSKKKGYSELLQENLFSHQNDCGKVLNFTQDNRFDCNNNNQNGKQNLININNMPVKNTICNSDCQRKTSIKKMPYKILDAPYLRDDFYLNLVDWSSNDHIGVGLQSSIYVWSGCTSKVKKIYEAEAITDYICSIAFLKHTNKICSGLTEGRIKIFDIQKTRSQVDFEGLHFGRVGSLGCTHNNICTGGRDGYVTIQDYRMQKQLMRYKAHNQEICGLKICPNNDIIATGGNDNKLVLFSMRKFSKLATFQEHQAAVKAIGFSPKQPIVASGGGTADRKLRLFNLHTLQMVNQVDTGSQVCNLLYSPISNELVTTHGYSLNQINLWKYGPNGQLSKLQSIMGHKSRVLYLAGQYNGGKMVTGAGDQQLRLWKIFDQKEVSIASDLR